MTASSLPSNYAEIGRWSLTQASVKELLLAVAASLILFLISLVTVGLIAFVVTGSDRITIEGSALTSGFLVGIVAGVVLHELVHGAVFSAFHARPRFGFKPWTRFGPVFFATAPGNYLSRTKYLAVGLSPALLLTAALVVALAVVFALELEGGFLSSVVLWIFLLNTVGSAGDLFIAAKVMGYPSTTYFEDTSEGFVAYGPTNVDESRQ